MTISETLFEDFCARAGIPSARVAEAESRRPDYEIKIVGHRVVVEVKQFDPNEEEAESNLQMNTVGVGGILTIPGDRIRKAIRSAAPQLWSLSRGECPTMLVAFDNSGSSLHTDPYAVATAMDGLDVITISVPSDASIPPRFHDPRSGPNKKMTPNANTTISAIAVLHIDSERKAHLGVYHNRFARHPIEPELMRHPLVRHLRRPDGAVSSLEGWDEV